VRAPDGDEAIVTGEREVRRTGAWTSCASEGTPTTIEALLTLLLHTWQRDNNRTSLKSALAELLRLLDDQ
jgi:hypothetical protein